MSSDDEVSNDIKKKKKKKVPIVAILIIIGAGIVFIIALVNLISINQNYKHIEETNNSVKNEVVQETQQATAEKKDNGLFVYDHRKALAINPDAQGYLSIPSTQTKLPIVQGVDNDYYLHKDFYGNYSLGGTPFVDCDIEDGIDDNYVIIYGHHMNDGSMFTPNENYKNADFYNEEGNDIFYIMAEDGARKYRIFSAFTIPISEDENFTSIYTVGYSEEDIPKMAAKWKALSFYDTGVDVSNATQVVSLSSCEENDYNSRLLVMGTYESTIKYSDIE